MFLACPNRYEITRRTCLGGKHYGRVLYGHTHPSWLTLSFRYPIGSPPAQNHDAKAGVWQYYLFLLFEFRSTNLSITIVLHFLSSAKSYTGQDEGICVKLYV